VAFLLKENQMNTNEIYDPYENPATTLDDNLPLRRDRIKSILAQIINHKLFKSPQQVKLLNPPIQRTRPGLTYIKDGPGHTDDRMVWLDSQVLFNPVFKFAIFKHIKTYNWTTSWNPFSTQSSEWYNLFPDVARLGGIGVFNNEDDADDDGQYNSTLQLMQFGSDESLAKFKLTNEYTPMHLIVSPPPPKTEAVFEDNDLAQYKGWIRLFKATDFDETEVRGIMANYLDFERMELAFLGDIRSLNSCYAAIGGKTQFAWISHRLSKTHKESMS
jgi:hypothetical protein